MDVNLFKKVDEIIIDKRNDPYENKNVHLKYLEDHSKTNKDCLIKFLKLKNSK